VGVGLAGGRVRRRGGTKAMAQLCGRHLISYPLAGLQAVLADVAVVAKRDTELPRIHGVDVWIEREPRQHPLVGLLEALTCANGRPVLVCAVDLPLVRPETVARLASTEAEPAPARVASHQGVPQPLLARYSARALDPLR